MSVYRIVLPCSLLLPLACADAPSGVEDASTVSGPGDTEAPPGGTGGASDSGVDDESTGEPPPTEQWARDIRIAQVEVNQGVGVPVALDQQWVGPEGRNAPLLGGRDTLIRVMWTLDPGFTPRPIEARLSISDERGEVSEQRQTLAIEGPADPRRLDGTFFFDLVADEARAGLRFSVELHEVEASAEPPPAELPVAPAEGPQLIGFQDGPMALRVHVVPLHAAWPGCTASPDTSPAVMDAFADSMFQRNPTTGVELTVADEPIVLTEAPQSLWDTFVLLQQRRVADKATPDQYYYGLLDACGATDIDGAGGMAFGQPTAGPDVGYQRVAAGLWLGWDLPWSSTTFVHEVGHLQGLAHVACEQSTPNPDPSFPHDNGSIGVWGFGITDFTLRNPDYARDYMSYCYDDNWVADWTWWETYDRIAALNAFERSAPPQPPGAQVLIGVLDEERERWWVTQGAPDGEGVTGGATEATTGLALTGRPELVPTSRHRIADGRATVVVATLAPGTSLDGALYIDEAGERHRVELATP